MAMTKSRTSKTRWRMMPSGPVTKKTPGRERRI
jgi:hypothetical protein